MSISENKNIVICGDSFNSGVGCHDLINEPYGSLLANHFNKKLINLAKSASTNLSIYLQVKYAIENIKDIDFVCVGVTSNERTEWFYEKNRNYNSELSNTMINYHQYPPYLSNDREPYIDNPLKDDINYTGEILTEPYCGIVGYVDINLNNPKNKERYIRFKHESDEKLRLLKDYYLNFFDIRIQRIYDMGVILMSHHLLKSNNIRHYILIRDDGFKNYIPDENLIDVDFFELAKRYPDDFNSFHTSEIGHRIVYDKIIDKING